MRRKKVKIILRHLLLFLIQMAFSRANFGNIFPIGLSFAFARIFFGSNLLLVTIEYAISNIFLWNRFFYLISAAFEIIIISLYYFLKESIVVKKKRLLVFLFLILSTMVKLYLVLLGELSLFEYILELVLKILSLIYFAKLYSVYQKKIIFLKCSNIDYLLFSTFIILFILGVFRYEIIKNSLALCVFVSAVLLACRILPLDKFLIFAITMSTCFGYILSSPKIVIMSLPMIMVLIAISRVNKYLFLSVFLGSATLLLRLAECLNLYLLLNISASVVLLAMVPQKYINKLIEFFEDKNLNIIKDNLWYESQNEIKSNLLLMSKTLEKMQEDFKFLMVGKIDRKYASEELAKDVIRKCCDGCERRIICENSLIDKNKILSEFILQAINKGSFFVNEIGVGFRTYCDKTIFVARNISDVAGQYLQFETSVKNEDESKLLISTELGNFAKMFQDFSKNIEKSPKINKNLSKIAKEMLMNNMINVVDIAVFENETSIEKIDVVAENNIMTRRELGETLAKFVRHRIQVNKLKHLEFSGLSLISFVQANNLRAEFAISSSAKEQVNGDNCVVSKIDDNRFFVAIADGMGHGKLAGKTSQMILGLIKNLFLIGISLDVIIESVNKLLIPVGLENFSTIDIAIVDLKMSKCTFVKLGSSVSAIKHAEKTEIVSGSSLPVGIVQNLKPTVKTYSIREDDIIVLASDGVVDSFNDIEHFRIFINDYKINNLQRFTDNVIFELGTKPNKHLDDMSIIALKLLKNSAK